jgi:hypothetical protein
MQEERSIPNGTPEWEPSGPVACGENEDSSRARGELRSRGRRDCSPTGNLDLRGFEDPDENFVQLVNSVPVAPNPCVSTLTLDFYLQFQLLPAYSKARDPFIFHGERRFLLWEQLSSECRTT